MKRLSVLLSAVLLLCFSSWLPVFNVAMDVFEQPGAVARQFPEYSDKGDQPHGCSNQLDG